MEVTMFATLRTLFRAAEAEAEEAVIDANGTRLLAQHLRDAETGTRQARRALASLMARRTSEERLIEGLDEEIGRREEEVRSALNINKQNLASEIADRIVVLEEERARAEQTGRDLTRRIDTLRSSVSQADRRISVLASELRAARAGQLCRKVSDYISEGLHPTALERAEAMALRVRDSGQRIEDEMAAMAELRRDDGEDLDNRLKSAGVADRDGARRRAVLARIKSSSEGEAT
jgi:phage shock protein A